MSKEEIIEKILSKNAFEIFQSKMLNTFIYYVNDKEFNRIKNHIYQETKNEYSTEIIDGEVVIVKNEEQEYDTIIIDCYIFKKVSREEKLNRLIEE